MDLNSFDDSIFFSTVRIATSEKLGDSVGTGFLLRANFDGALNGQGTTILISNKHVINESTQKVSLKFHKRNPHVNSPILGQTVPGVIADLKRDAIYIEHPDIKVDLACLVANVIEDPKYGVYARTISRAMIATYEEPELKAGKDAWFVGYPADRYDITNNLPLLRHGHIASIPTVDFDGKREIVIDAQVFPGSSGSPVFTDINNKMKLIGIVVETMIDYQEVEVLPTSTGLGIAGTLGLGIVLKSTLLNPLIDAALAKVLALKSVEESKNQ